MTHIHRKRWRTFPLWVLIACLVSGILLVTDTLVAGSSLNQSAASAASQASAQTSSVSGRHAPAPVPTGPTRFKVTFGAGVLTSGDLFKIEVVSRNPQPWLSPAGSQFNSEEFVVTLDESLLLAVSLFYRLGGQWWLRGDLSYAKLDATTEALVGQTVELHLYDRLAFLMAGLTVERPLIATTSYPFLLAGAALVDIKADHAAELNQSGLGWRLGVGYHHTFNNTWGLRLEIRDTIMQIDTSAHEPINLNPQDPETTKAEYGPQHLFELALLIQRRL
jgi:hypothetical protein